ncbi:hypothetical protein BLA29_009503 [Euroglyphus maynei]|uniref:Uncharacterized protein n=1 Tax=Euroglyphus maynei TaxID=6958 RepID=A0A1Y3BHJ1_EURMA|nr:hypothetical protein BLA29_009503 [Euroglyphus maynei]
MAMRSSPPSSSMFLVVHPLPSNDDELNDKILETVEKFRPQTNPNNPANSGGGGGLSNSHSNVPVINFPESSMSSAISQNESSTNGSDSSSMKITAQQQPSSGQTVLQCVVSRSHVAVLLDDHRVCRYPFNIYAERINGSNVQSESSSSSTNAKK